MKEAYRVLPCGHRISHRIEPRAPPEFLVTLGKTQKNLVVKEPDDTPVRNNHKSSSLMPANVLCKLSRDVWVVMRDLCGDPGKDVEDRTPPGRQSQFMRRASVVIDTCPAA